jgi:hypothetical protein
MPASATATFEKEMDRADTEGREFFKSAVNGHREGVRRSQYTFLRGQVSAAAAATRLADMRLADMEKATKSALGRKAQSQREQ